MCTILSNADDEAYDDDEAYGDDEQEEVCDNDDDDNDDDNDKMQQSKVSPHPNSLNTKIKVNLCLSNVLILGQGLCFHIFLYFIYFRVKIDQS